MIGHVNEQVLGQCQIVASYSPQQTSQNVPAKMTTMLEKKSKFVYYITQQCSRRADLIVDPIIFNNWIFSFFSYLKVNLQEPIRWSQDQGDRVHHWVLPIIIDLPA